MPSAHLSPAARRELTLRALRGESYTKLAESFGIARTTIYYHVEQVRENVSEELPFWKEVEKLVSPEATE